MIRPLSCFCLLLFCAGLLRAQVKLAQVVDPISAKMEWYWMKKKPSNLFVHFDKNIYIASEHVWLTAYLLSPKNSSPEHHTIAVALISNEDSSLVVHHKFVMKDGLGFGHFLMPDTLPEGNYSLMAFTNVLSDEKPVASFVQPITIKTAVQSGFTANLKLAQKIMPGADSAKISFKAFAKDIRTLASYTEVSYSLGKLQRSLKTDVFGDASFSVPLHELTLSNNRVKLKASFKNETKKLQLNLPLSNNEPMVKFFPEGGSIAADVKTTVGWEVHDVYGQPMAISAVLFRNNETVDTIQTNSFGMGRFSITAKPGEGYHVKLFRSGLLTGDYTLPPASVQPVSISIANAACKDTLVFYSEAPVKGMYYALIHDYTGSYFSFLIDMNSVRTRRFRVPLTKIPKGIHTITLFDSESRPLAERLFFAHSDQRAEIEMVTDKKQYATRENVKLSIRLKDALPDSVNGFVSVACVQDNRIDPRKIMDIESYTYLNNELANVPFKRNAMQPSDDNFQHWEDLLLIKGWRRYTWTDLVASKISDTALSFSEILFKGNVTARKKISKPVEIALVFEKGADMVNTDNEGNFDLPHEKIITETNKKILLSAGGASQSGYTINLQDPYYSLAQKLRMGLAYSDPDAYITEKNSETLVLKKGESAEVLAEVTVTASRKDGFPTYATPSGRNECGDYVCEKGILNCNNHTFGTPPEKGKRYWTPVGGQTLYAGCVVPPFGVEKTFVKTFDGIYLAKEFYKTDYTQFAPSEQALTSTIFWDYAVAISNTKTTELSFPTSDIPGNFRVVIQGLTTKGVIHAEHVFSVTKPN